MGEAKNDRCDIFLLTHEFVCLITPLGPFETDLG